MAEIRQRLGTQQVARGSRREFGGGRGLQRDGQGDGMSFMLAAALLVLGWAVMCWPWLSGAVTIPWDAKAHFQPQIQFLADSLRRGESPFWNPYVFAGHPQIADPQAMIFSPPFLLLALVNGSPSSWAIDVTVLLAQLAGALALMLWFRDRGWHPAGAIIAGLVFCFGASMAWRVQHTGQVLSLAYWPFAVLLLDRVLDCAVRPERRGAAYGYAAALGVVAAAMVLGRDQVALLLLYVLAGFVVWRWSSAASPRSMVRRSLPPLIAGGVIAVALIAVPLVLTALLAAESNRPAFDFESAGRGSMHPALFLTFVIPQLFGAAGRMEDYWGPPSFAWNDTGIYIAQNMGQVYLGLVPLLLMGIGLLRGQLWDREIRFFAIVFVLIVFYALGWYTPIFRAFYEFLPGVKLYRRPADATFLIGGVGAVLAGYATHRLFAAPWMAFDRRAIVAGGVALALVFAVSIWLGFRIDRVALLSSPVVTALMAVVAAFVALWFVRSRIALEPWLAAGVLAGVTAVDLAVNNGPSTSSALPPSVYEAMEPQTKNPLIVKLKALAAAGQSETRRDRVELLGLGFHWPNVSMTHGLENTLGYNPVRLGLYSRATGAEDTVGLPEQRKFPPLFSSYASPLVALLGLRYIATPTPLDVIDKRLKFGDVTAVFGSADGLIFENPKALPRVLFAPRAMFADFEQMLRTGIWPEHDPALTVLLEGAPRDVGTVRRAGTVRIVSYRNTEVVLEADSPDGGFVVLNDLWHPWWVADVDGRATPIRQANVLFRAVEVLPGKHQIRFTFEPVAGAWRQIAAGRAR